MEFSISSVEGMMLKESRTNDLHNGSKLLAVAVDVEGLHVNKIHLKVLYISDIPTRTFSL